MLNPSIGSLLGEYESKYQLVLDVAKRARVISEKADENGVELAKKPVDMAMDQICENMGL